MKKMAFICLLFLLFPSFVFGLDELYDAPGFSAWRETFSTMPDEYVDPFTGGLILNHVDFRLPGNGGLDLVIQRTFNSKNVWRECWFTGSTCSCDKGENTWLGYGWTLHFGRLFKSTNININPFIEMPDGSIHTAYRKTGLEYITKDYWLLDGTSNVLTLTNGTKIYFVQLGPQHPGYLQHNVYYATKIQDINGNTIDIFYRSSNGSSRSNIISYVLDSGGRRIDFTTSTINGAARLTSISGPGVSISYTHQPQTTWSDTILTKANLPVGNPWEYTYDGQELKSVKSPYGGMVTYTYGCYSVNACGKIFTCKRVARKSTSGRNIPSGTWTFSYFQGTNNEYTQISDPCGRTIKYSYYGYGSVSNGSTWKIGLPKSKEIVGEETITYNWINSSYISIDDYILRYCGFDHEIYVPLLTSKSITRGGKTYATNYSNYDSYGNPKTISESGDKSRTTTKTYWYNTSKNIVQDKPSSETVSGGFSGTFKTNYFYDSNGNLTQLNKYGVVTNYSYYSNGNLYSITDANGKTTYYQWSNGRISKVTNPVYSISRSINSNGTIASETNGRGYTTNYTYDGNLRLTKIQPPVGNPTYFAYLSDNSYKKETRGGYYIYYYYDGFGRTSGTYDSKGVDTDIIYKSCGPKNYTTSNIGDTVYYDNFGRTRESVHKDSTKITYSYSGSNITVTDEAGNKTYLTYNAFGNPDEKFLVSVKDALNNTTTYGRNILGSLTGITQSTLTRTYSYNSKNFLTSETHPECGTISYTRDNVGNMTAKTDSLGTKYYTYDSINRLTKITYGGETVYFDYDNANNRIGMTSPSADIDYTYDAANRLTQKIENIAGRTYSTRYDYDANDNIINQYYPTGTWVTYKYNSNNQVTEVTGFGGSILSISYNIAGLPTTYTFSNGLTTNITYNNRNLTTRITSGSAFDNGYSYDSRGNTTAITNYLESSKNQSFTYDNLSRVTGFNGAWGTGSYRYDATGNRLSKTAGGSTTSYSYSNNRLSSTSGGEPQTFSHNGYGSLIATTWKGINYSLTYDILNNLKSYKSGTMTLADFSYDGDGMRVTKTSSGKTVVYHYDKDGRVISETDSSGNLIADYIYVNGKLMTKVIPSSLYFYHTDPAGTPMVMTDSIKNIVWKADYRPFGEEQTITGTIENNEKFVGKEKDRETGLYYFGARYMEPRIGRFVVIDPVGPVSSQTGKTNEKLLLNPQKLNRYAYAGNNPYRYVDPDGRTWLEFVRGSNILLVYPGTRETEGPPRVFPAGNNTTNPTGDPNRVGSKAPAPTGTFPVQNPINTEGRPEYGPYFFPIGEVGPNGERLDIARQRGIGIHGGRSGPESRTHGCIRVSDETDRTLYEIHQADPITSITIRVREEEK